MAEDQSIDGFFSSRETDEEKSFKSAKDMFPVIAEIGKDTDTINERKKLVTDIGNGDNDSDRDAIAVAKRKRKRSPATAAVDDGKNGGNDNDNNNNKNNQNQNQNQNHKRRNIPTESKKKKERKHPHRNTSTLMALKRTLKSGNCFRDTLEYEEVSAFASKIHRYAVEQTRGRSEVLFQDVTIQNGYDPTVKIRPIIMTAEDIAREREYHQIYQKEEFYAVATKFMKTVREGAHSTGGSEFVLHKKTANWLKRAAGMNRQYDPFEKDDNQQQNNQQKPAISEESDEGDIEAISGKAGGGDDRRLTRRRVLMTRKKRELERRDKETENFRILSEVTLELSNQTRVGRTKKGIKGLGFTSNDTTDDDEDAKMTHTTIPKEIDECAVSDKTLPSLESTGLTTIYGPYCRADDTGLRFLNGDEIEPHEMEGSILPPVVARLGLEFRTRPPGLEEARRTFPVAPQGHAISNGISGGRDADDRTLFRKPRTLRNALSNKRARYWAIHEFFYSDLDKEWYRNDGFVSDLAKLGLPIDARTRLTRQEWSLVRRELQPRFRLFSKKFIAEQLKRRNRHRALVRSLQQDPREEEFAPIRVGTPVTAYDKHGRTIRRGRILHHDSKKHRYLVQFDDKNSGCDICPDFEVAVFLPVKARTSPPPLYKPHPEFLTSKTEDKDFVELVIPNGIASGGCLNGIERELLISSIAVAMEAFERKKAILKALESCADTSEEGSSKHCSRLMANLHRINTTLESALAYLQVLYGRIYGSPVSNHETPKAEIEKMKLNTEIPKSEAFEIFLTSIASISNKVGAVAFSFGDNAKNKNRNKNRSSSSENLRDDLSSSTSLLLLANYLAETSSSLASSRLEKTTYSSAIDAALKTLLDRYSNKCLPPTHESLLVGKKLEQESMVEEELKNLWVAVGMLRTEAALATDENRTFELRNAII